MNSYYGTGSAYQCFACGRWVISPHNCTVPAIPPLCPRCFYNHWEDSPCVKSNPAPAPESAGGETKLSLIDERQVEVLNYFRSARDTARRYAQTKVDRATLMKIQAEALIAESRELVAELNEDVPYANEEGADIGPVRGAGGSRR